MVALVEDNTSKVRALRSRFMGLPEKQYDKLRKA